MKPSFALNITDSAIGLLHRTARGWLQVGETAFDTADLAEALGYLRGSALGLSPGGLTTKLVLPNSQIKYLQLDAPGPTETDRRTQIRAALVGRTPYAVEDLVFDWSGTGPKVQVAVVARETLDEAEAFATEHRFNPVSFVGLPAAGDFKGEPWFGPTKLSATLLEKGEKVDRDSEAVQVAARDLPKSHPIAQKAASDSSSDETDTADKSLADADKPTRAQRRAAAAAAEQARTANSAASVAAVPVRPERSWDAPPPIAEGPIAERPIAFPEIGTTDVEPAPAAVASRVVPAEPAQAAGAFVTENQAFPEVGAASAIDDDPMQAADDLPPAPSAAIMAAFASRRATDLSNAKPFGAPAPAPAPAPTAAPVRPLAMGTSDLADRLGGKATPPPLTRPRAAEDAPSFGAVTDLDLDVPDGLPAGVKPASAKSGTAFVTAPSIPGARKRKSSPTEVSAKAGASDARKPLTKPGGTFASSKDRGKPRYLGLILTGLLLLFLALIAAWSSFFMASNPVSETGTAVVSAPGTAAPADQASADIPAVNDEMLADSQDPASFATANPAAEVAEGDPSAVEAAGTQPQTAAVAPDATAVETTLSAANAPPVAAPDPAPVGIAATDSPNAAPLNETQDEIFLTEIDNPPSELDPLALPVPAAAKDALPLAQAEPPPFGTTYQFDANGRILPTPEGVITPEGVRLVAGKPTVLPPQRPSALAATLPAASAPAAGAATPVLSGAAAPAAFPSDPALAGARPRARPLTLVPQTSGQAGDTTATTDPAATAAAGKRPLPRPASVLAAGEAAHQSTAAASLAAQAEQSAAVEAAVLASVQPDAEISPLAVSVSRRPAARPKDMSRAVEAAVTVAVRQADTSTAASQQDTAKQDTAQQDTSQQEADSEPELASVAPEIPIRAKVAKQATFVNVINLSKINLIGVYGSRSNPYALIRQSNGRYKKVKVGDTIDGGRVAAISSGEVRYQKSGRMISLRMPKT